ncbi:uncharacterized protein J3D65DRAFT_670675 [Phyllosticta citribraziliensis]|uniref:Gag protein n=1 Tax=Phyllosticta citribraziliensis TaxID=989973 RepID=A0ABR1LBH5_9PEZI
MSSTPFMDISPAPSRLSFSNDYWALRMGDDESLDDFQERVRALEAKLGYKFSSMPEKQKIDMWLSRLPPELLSTLGERTNDLKTGLTTLDQLFDQVHRVQLEHHVNLAKSYWGQRMKPGESFRSFKKGIKAIEKKLGYVDINGDWDVNGGEREEIDKWLLRLSPELLEKLRKSSNNLRGIKSAKALVAQIEQLERRDGIASTAVTPTGPRNASSRRGGRGGIASTRTDQRHHPYNNARRQHETRQQHKSPTVSAGTEKAQEAAQVSVKRESSQPVYRLSPCVQGAEDVQIKDEPEH